MKAVRWHATAEVRVDDVDTPVPQGPRGVVIAVEACGICGTDVEEARHGPNSIPAAHPHPLTGRMAPLTLGHEILGEITQAGPASGRRVGERVVVWPSIPCERCETCLAGEQYRCPNAGCLGLSADGGMAAAVAADGRYTVVIEREVPMKRAVLAEPYAVAFHAFGRYDPGGRSVAVFGVGSIGSAVIDVARHLGATRIIGVSRSPENRRVAEQAGATEVISPSEAPGLRVDIAVDASGSREAVRQFTDVLGHGGVGVVVGVKRQIVELPVWELFQRELQIVGSNGSRFEAEFARAVQLIAEGRLAANPRPVVEAALEDVPGLLLGDEAQPVGAKLVAVPG